MPEPSPPGRWPRRREPAPELRRASRGSDLRPSSTASDGQMRELPPRQTSGRGQTRRNASREYLLLSWCPGGLPECAREQFSRPAQASGDQRSARVGEGPLAASPSLLAGYGNCYDDILVGQSIMIRFEDILDKVESYRPDFDEELLQKAYIFSALEHRGQTRSSGEPYLVHPLNVAHILADLRLDETSI